MLFIQFQEKGEMSMLKITNSEMKNLNGGGLLGYFGKRVKCPETKMLEKHLPCTTPLNT